jgi:hypothetical protein
MECRFTDAAGARGSCANQGGIPNCRWIRGQMSQNHYTTKSKRRQKSKKRKDTSQGTMAKIRQLEAAEKKKQ